MTLRGPLGGGTIRVQLTCLRLKYMLTMLCDEVEAAVRHIVDVHLAEQAGMLEVSFGSMALE